jgi:hypothetical protein
VTDSFYNSDQSLPGYIRAARELHQMLAKMQGNDRLTPEREWCVIARGFCGSPLHSTPAKAGGHLLFFIAGEAISSPVV